MTRTFAKAPIKRAQRAFCLGSTDVTSREVLVSTLTFSGGGWGGVHTMTAFVVETLREGGFQPVVAFYEPYTVSPDLSVPAHRLLARRPGSRARTSVGDVETYAMGAWLPELQFTQYWASEAWRKLIDRCPYHIAVCGSVHAALPFSQLKQPFLCWAATPWEDDWRDRVRTRSMPRWLFETVVSAPVLRRMEKRILNLGQTIALSAYTARRLDEIAGGPTTAAIMPMPVASERFEPDPSKVVPGRIGFTGRFMDPRKNISLLLEATAYAASQGTDISLDLIGDTPGADLQDRVAALGLRDRVQFIPSVAQATLISHLQQLDVFVLPSHQEGLCIAALEAMSCGCPVVSTRCGGPEEYVIDGVTGYPVDSTAEALGSAIIKITSDRGRRGTLGLNARRLVIDRYSPQAAKAVFWRSFQCVFPNARPMHA